MRPPPLDRVKLQAVAQQVLMHPVPGFTALHPTMRHPLQVLAVAAAYAGIVWISCALKRAVLA
jgi:hypothetical protein